MISALNDYISKDLADDTYYLKTDKIYIYHGTQDYTVTEGINVVYLYLFKQI